MTGNPFILDKHEYKRNVNPEKQYIDQATNFLMTQRGCTKEQAREFVINELKNPIHKVYDPRVNYLRRGDNEDREPAQIRLTQYLGSVLKEREVLAPTFTSYTDPRKGENFLVVHTEKNVIRRGKAKAMAFKLKAMGQAVLASIQNCLQKGFKLRNNSLSGLAASPSTPFYNKTSHSTLTTICRITASYGNGNNEKLLAGHRHYYNPEIVISNIASITTLTDMVEIKRVMDKYNLNYPNTEAVMQAILASSQKYWGSKSWEEKITKLVEKLSPVQKAAFLYTGDLYHIRKHNNEFVRVFVSKLSKKVTGEFENPLEYLDKAATDYICTANLICGKEMAGYGRNYATIPDKEVPMTVANTVKNLVDTVDDYGDFIKCFFTSMTVPASIGYLPNCIRDVAIVSDTDSTLFTVQDWVQWYRDTASTPEEINDEAVACSIAFVVGQTIAHILAQMSANLGVKEERMFQIKMKNEYYMPAFAVTQKSKHYWYTVRAQEGSIYKTPAIDYRGVHLQNSNASATINKMVIDDIEEICRKIAAGEKIEITASLKKYADVERTIKADIISGGLGYFRTNDIKSSVAYKEKEGNASYQKYLFWNEVFGPKYGLIEQLPVTCLKLPTEITNGAAIQDWLCKIKDPDLRERLRVYTKKMDKKNYEIIFLPLDVARTHGLPEEIALTLNVDKLVHDSCISLYLVLETIGFYFTREKKINLLSSIY